MASEGPSRSGSLWPRGLPDQGPAGPALAYSICQARLSRATSVSAASGPHVPAG